MPRTVAAALADLPDAPGGLAARAFAAAEERFGEDATSAVASCLACARFGMTREELRAAATRRAHAQRARARDAREEAAEARRARGLGDEADADVAKMAAEEAAEEAAFARARASLASGPEGFDALFATFRPWLAPWCSRDAWTRELEPFDEDEDDALDGESERRRRPLAVASAAGDVGDVPFAFRDAYARAAALERYAPAHAVDPIDGESVRRRLHADLAAHFLDLPDFLRLNLPADVHGSGSFGFVVGFGFVDGRDASRETRVDGFAGSGTPPRG